MEQEVRNVINALNELRDEVVTGGAIDNLVSPDLIRRFHRMIGKDLGAHFEAAPGQFRRGQVTVGRVYRPPAGSEVGPLMTAFCDWSRKEFHFEKGQSFSTAIIQAIVSHVYVAWIHPFGDGNGRTARLLEFYLLLRAGVPDIAAHILSNFYNETRSEYYRQLALSSRNKGDLTGFIAYAVQGLKDGLLVILETVHANQLLIAWRDYVRETFQVSGMKTNLTYRRQMALILSVKLEQEYSESDLAEVNAAVRVSYAMVSRRTLQRDILALISYGLLVHSDQGYRANTAVLRGPMAKVRADRRLL
ncbi:MAG: Fic family protein [Leptospirales bacterium]|nr:Fic family protein [Leptospirales bacterium]